MPTHYRGTRAETRALDAFITLTRAAASVLTRTSAPLSPLRLTTSQFGALEALLHLGPLQQRELGAKILKTSGNVTMVVDNLERRGLVRRQRETDDRRCVRVHLTPEGRALVRRAFPRVLAAIGRELATLSPTEQDDLRRLTRKLGLGKPTEVAREAAAGRSRASGN